MQIKETEIGSLVVATVESERLDMATGPKFKKQMESVIKRRKSVVVNMEQVRFVDSSGFGAILACARDLHAVGEKLLLCGVQKRVRVLLELVQIHRIVTIVNSVDEALAEREGAFDSDANRSGIMVGGESPGAAAEHK